VDAVRKLLPDLQNQHLGLSDVFRAPGFHHPVIEVRRVDHQVILDHLNDKRVGFGSDVSVIHKEILFLETSSLKMKSGAETNSLKTRKIHKSQTVRGHGFCQ
jgi:hypothetical protein